MQMPAKRSVVAVAAGAALAWILGRLLQWLVWPRVLGAGLLDLDQLLGRLLFILVGAIPVVIGGYVAARLAPRQPLRHGLAVGVLLLLGVLVDLPRILRAYEAVPQPMWPLLLSMALRPLAGMGGAYLTGRVLPQLRGPDPSAVSSAE
jgi:hypothetical protein